MGVGFFSVAIRDITRSNGFKGQQIKSRLQIRRNFLIMGVVMYGKSLPQESPFLEICKSRLHRHLAQMV